MSCSTAVAVRRPPVTGEGLCGSRPGEQGGATLIGLALAGFILLAGLAAVDVGALTAARAAAQTAADTAALAALTPALASAAPPTASTPQPGLAPQEGPEARAAQLAAANRAELVACDCSAVEAVVTVRRQQRLVPEGLTVTLTARARAVLGLPPGAVRATVRGDGSSRVVHGDLAGRVHDPAGGGAGRCVGERERGDGGDAVRGLGGGGQGCRPRRSADQPRGPPDRAGRAAAGGDPAGRRARPAAGAVGAAAAVRAAEAGAVHAVPAHVQHRAAVHRGLAGSGDAGHHAHLERVAGEDRRGAAHRGGRSWVW